MKMRMRIRTKDGDDDKDTDKDEEKDEDDDEGEDDDADEDKDEDEIKHEAEDKDIDENEDEDEDDDEGEDEDADEGEDANEDEDKDEDEDKNEDEDEDAALSRCRSATARPLPSPHRSPIPGSVSGSISGSPGIPNPRGAGTQTPLDRPKSLAGVLELGVTSSRCKIQKLSSLSRWSLPSFSRSCLGMSGMRDGHRVSSFNRKQSGAAASELHSNADSPGPSQHGHFGHSRIARPRNSVPEQPRRGFSQIAHGFTLQHILPLKT